MEYLDEGQIEQLQQFGELFSLWWEFAPEQVLLIGGALGLGILGLVAGGWFLLRSRRREADAVRRMEEVEDRLASEAKPYRTRADYDADIRNPDVSVEQILARCKAGGCKVPKDSKPPDNWTITADGGWTLYHDWK